MDTVFLLSNLLVMPLWLMMIFAPGWRVTLMVMRSPLAVLPAALLYAVLVVPVMVDVLPVLSRPELGPIAALLGTPEGATIGWIHFLAFDLFVGRWVLFDARERGLPSWIVSPVLLVVLMFGPLGFATYLGVRAVRAKRTTGDETL